MANYNLYKNINPGNITSATSSLRSKLTPAQTKLSSFQSSLNDNIWKAKSKSTLLTAFKTIDGEVYKEVLDNLSKLDEAAGYIKEYNDAKKIALQYKEKLAGATEKTPQSDISSWQSEVSKQEGIMDSAESKVNGLL